MKKAFLLLVAGLLMLPVASFATVADESLGQGSGFDAGLRTGSNDLLQIMPEKASDFSNTFFLRFGVPDYQTPGNKGSYNSGYDGNGLIFGSDNWFGVIDSKHGIGTWGVFLNVPVNYF